MVGENFKLTKQVMDHTKWAHFFGWIGCTCNQIGFRFKSSILCLHANYAFQGLLAQRDHYWD